MIIKGGAIAYPTSISGAKAPKRRPNYIAVIDYTIIINKKFKKYSNSGLN